MRRKESGTHRTGPAVTVPAAVLLVLGLAGCGGGSEPVATTPPAAARDNPPGAACPTDAAEAKAVWFGEDDHLGGLVFGSGKTAIVLSHEDGRNLCAWMPYAPTLAAKGYLVLDFDFSGFGSSDLGATTRSEDELAAVDYLHSQGVTSIVLMGASMGGQAALEAAQKMSPEPLAVVSLSGPRTYQGDTVSTKDLDVPTLFVAAADDNGGSFADDARSLAKEMPKGLATVKIAVGGGHGTDLLGRGLNTEVTDPIEKLLARYAPPT